MKRFFLAAALALASASAAAPASAAPIVAPQELEHLRNTPEVRIIDIRPADLYAKNHIPGAL
ncbi:MAG: sulfurtransferase, partial [Alcaligenaceae bacterium]|nr:sulfurtransferase [Alcaligenaceae bacterium]